jgi:NAD(P)H-hydrate epimerase
VITPPDAYPQIAPALTSVMVRPEDDAQGTLVANPERYSAAVVGPGWGSGTHRHEQLCSITGAFATGVIDADGLNVLAQLQAPPALDSWVLAPHPAELARLLDRTTDDVLADFYGCAAETARRYGAVVVAKACTTIVARPDGRVSVVDGANPGLGTAGSGDVLSGVIGAMLGRGMSSWDAARCGALVHAEAGRSLRDRAGMFRSSALPDEIGRLAGQLLLGH